MFSSLKKTLSFEDTYGGFSSLCHSVKGQKEKRRQRVEDIHTHTHITLTHTYIIFLTHMLICIHVQSHSPALTFTQHHAYTHTHTHTHTQSVILRYNDPLATLLLKSRRLIFQKHVGEPQQFEFILNFRFRGFHKSGRCFWLQSVSHRSRFYYSFSRDEKCFLECV